MLQLTQSENEDESLKKTQAAGKGDESGNGMVVVSPGAPSSASSGKRKKETVYRKACEVCGLLNLETSEMLRDHLSSHLEDGSRVCPIPTCKKMMGSVGSLKKHLLASHHRLEKAGHTSSIEMVPDMIFALPQGTMLECFECEERFSNAVALDCHFRKHLMEEFPRECCLLIKDDPCNFTAQTQDDMARHIILQHYELRSRVQRLWQHAGQSRMSAFFRHRLWARELLFAGCLKMIFAGTRAW